MNEKLQNAIEFALYALNDLPPAPNGTLDQKNYNDHLTAYTTLRKEFLRHQSAPLVASLTPFQKGYILTGLLHSKDHYGIPFRQNHGPQDIGPQDLEKIIKECKDFLEKAKDLLPKYPGKTEEESLYISGGDFYLNRNLYDTGFLSRDIPEDTQRKLYKLSLSYGKRYFVTSADTSHISTLD